MIITSTGFFKKPPLRIISLVPSQTELLSYFGLDEEVIGITKFCVHPSKWFTAKTRVGGTKKINIPLIKKLQPDLVIANKEENVKEQVEELAKDFPVWVTDVNSLEDALQMIMDIGELTHYTDIAGSLIAGINHEFAQLSMRTDQLPTCYLIWKDPYMAAGHNTFINDMMKHCGFKNIFKPASDEYSNRYPEVSIASLQIARCRLLLLSSEPYPFRQKHVKELQKQLPGTKIILVDGEMFSWYGSRLLQAPKYFENLLRSLDS